MTAEQDELRRKADALYDQYAKPLEEEHPGEYVAISQDGKILLGNDILKVTQEATDTFGRGNFVFKLGPRAVGRWR
jgi:hypothetical protein